MKTIILSYPHASASHAGNDYRVIQVEQSTEYKPDQFLTEEVVKELCEMKGIWKIVCRKRNERGE